MNARATALLIAAALCGGGLLFAAVALATIPLNIGGPGFGYKKLILLLVGLESTGCGLLLIRRMRSAEWGMRNRDGGGHSLRSKPS